MIKKIISGGQTGSDRAGLNIAIEFGLKTGGWAPNGYLAEDGKVPELYKLKEYFIPGYPHRTLQNILDSDGTIIFCYGTPTGGTKLTIKYCRKHDVPYFIVNFKQGIEIPNLASWVIINKIRTLNVAGPRMSTEHNLKINIAHNARKLLKELIRLTN